MPFVHVRAASPTVVVQAQPLPAVIVTCADGHVLTAIDYRDALAVNPRDVRVQRSSDALAVYDSPLRPPAAATERMAALAHALGANRWVTVSIPAATKTHTTLPHPLVFPGHMQVAVYPLSGRMTPQHGDLALVQLAVPDLAVGIVLQGSVGNPATAPAPPPTCRVLIVPVTCVAAAAVSRDVAALDVDLAVILDPQDQLRKDPIALSAVDRLYELWVDVYRVRGHDSFAARVGVRGLVLPDRGRHASTSARLWYTPKENGHWATWQGREADGRYADGKYGRVGNHRRHRCVRCGGAGKPLRANGANTVWAGELRLRNARGPNGCIHAAPRRQPPDSATPGQL